MSASHVSGPLTSDNGFVGAVTGDVTGNLTGNVTGTVSAGITSGADNTEINTRADDSAMVDVRTGAGAIAVTTAYTSLVTTAADALTLDVPTKPAFLKVIKMATDGGDGTLASTNIVGQSSGTTSITFNDVGDTLVLISDTVSGKWVVLKEVGVTAA